MKKVTAFAKYTKRFFGGGPLDLPKPADKGLQSQLEAALKPLVSRLPPANTICVYIICAYALAAICLLSSYTLFPAAAKVKSGFKPKTFYQNWLSDKGAYPIMTILVVAFTLPLSFAAYKLATDPDARFRKTLRKSFLRSWDEIKDKST